MMATLSGNGILAHKSSAQSVLYWKLHGVMKAGRKIESNRTSHSEALISFSSKLGHKFSCCSTFRLPCDRWIHLVIITPPLHPPPSIPLPIEWVLSFVVGFKQSQFCDGRSSYCWILLAEIGLELLYDLSPAHLIQSSIYVSLCVWRGEMIRHTTSHFTSKLRCANWLEPTLRAQRVVVTASLFIFKSTSLEIEFTEPPFTNGLIESLARNLKWLFQRWFFFFLFCSSTSEAELIGEQKK